MTSPLILCPDRFTKELSFYDLMISRYGQRYRQAMATRRERPSHSSRRHAYKQPGMCGECLYGKHLTCTSAECSCIHREGDVPK
jgi:hypothetical protein